MKTILQVVVMVGVSLTALVAFAQRGPGGPGGPYGGPGGPYGGPGSPYGGPGSPYGGRGGPPFGGSFGGPGGSYGDHSRGSSDHQSSEEEIKSRLDRSEAFLREMDKNGNGILEANEVPPDRLRLLEFMAQRGGYEVKLPMSIAQMRKSSEDYYRARSTGATPGGAPSSTGGFASGPGSTPPSRTSSLRDSGPSVYGFVPGGLPPSGIGFGGTTASSSNSTSAPPSTSSRSRGGSQTGPFEQLDSQSQQRIRDLVAAVMRKYDKDRNGRLEKDEWPGGRLGSFDEANRFGGSTIAPDELLVHFADYLKRGQLPSDMLAGSSGLGTSVASSQLFKPKSGRFLTPSERLPKGLPEWFYRGDRDGDGQITMAEYVLAVFNNEFTPQAAAAFDRYDLNHDGIITPEECLKAERMPK